VIPLLRLDLTMNRVRVGIAGFGTVGRATAGIISAHADLIAQRTGVWLDLFATDNTVSPKEALAPLGPISGRSLDPLAKRAPASCIPRMLARQSHDRTREPRFGWTG